MRVLIRPSVCIQFDTSARACAGKPEAGGVLIGKYRGPHLELTQFTTPARHDIRTLRSFVKSDSAHGRFAIQAWRQSGMTETNVGEWHSHPSGEVVPSNVDRRTWRDLAVSNARPMIFVLVVPGSWGVFLQSRTAESARRLFLRESVTAGKVFGTAQR